MDSHGYIGEIEEGISIPPRTNPKGKGYTAAIRELKVGQCRLIALDPPVVSNLIAQMGERGNFTTRKEGDYCTRVWRIQ